MFELHYKKNEYVYREGDLSNEVYIVKDGSFSVLYISIF
jgi:CRP-like cAMP-binding protein